MSYDLIIKNGQVVLESGTIHTDIAVSNGKIVSIGQDLGDAKR